MKKLMTLAPGIVLAGSFASFPAAAQMSDDLAFDPSIYAGGSAGYFRLNNDDFLDEEDAAHFQELQDTLTALGTPFRVEPTLVRGLDYYSRTLFEVLGHGGELGAQNTLCGGGRYDGLVEQLGGPRTPAIGFAMGIERLLLVMGGEDAAPQPDVFVVIPHASARREAVVLLDALRAAGLTADADLRGGSTKRTRRSTKMVTMTER